MRFYVFDEKSEAVKAEKEISDLAGCPFDDGVNARTGKPFVPHPEGKTNNYKRRPKMNTLCWAQVRERRDGKFYFQIPENLDNKSRFKDIPLLNETEFKYTIEVFSRDWWPDPLPNIPETEEEKELALENANKTIEIGS